MKKILFIFGIAGVLLVSACEGPEGPQGAQGNEGPQGPAGESGYIFEFENIDFVSPDFSVVLEYPTDFTALDSDVALVYLLWEVKDIDGELTDVWRPLPQTLFIGPEALQYNYDFTKNDVFLFIEGEADPNELDPIYTEDWIARVVIVPGNFWNNGGRTEMPDYETLKELLNLPDRPTKIVLK